jgi:hypothetical protein
MLAAVKFFLLFGNKIIWLNLLKLLMYCQHPGLCELMHYEQKDAPTRTLRYYHRPNAQYTNILFLTINVPNINNVSLHNLKTVKGKLRLFNINDY